ncbi:MAG: amidohydrolase, partial [Paenibacillus sp.]|nr:amidohydrolase [Paenibacillus sp.]
MNKQNLTPAAFMDRKAAPMLIRNGRLVLSDRVVHGAVAIIGGRIHVIIEEERLRPDGEVGTSRVPGSTIEDFLREYPEAAVIDADGNYVMPGLIDIHCDAIEKEVQPRPNTLFPLPLALMEFERKLPVHGITTMYHSLSLGVGLSWRGDQYLTGIVDLIGDYNKQRSMIRNLIHLRFAVS